jgi:hypothetical protein
MRLSLGEETKTLPETGSTEMPDAVFREDADAVAGPTVMKSDAPRTRSAAGKFGN